MSCNNLFGPLSSDLSVFSQLFRRHPSVEKVLVFGSRAKGTHQKGSDVDLALMGDISSGEVSRILGELDDLSTPYTFDVVAYSSLKHEGLKSHIDRVGKSVYVRPTGKSSE